VTLGYHIGKQWWGKGYTVEALRELLKFFFEEVDAGRIEAYHDPRNPNSGKVLQKAEFQFEGIMRKLSLTNQGICDLACYAIIADDYFAEKPRRCL
jgi:ribosomal-protein-alanine N-acetyltransferase